MTIRHRTNTPWTDQDLLGKYTLVDAGASYPAFRAPLLVDSLSAGKANGREPQRVYLSQEALWVLHTPAMELEENDIVNKGEEGLSRSRKSIVCVCDTAKEVNALLRVSRANELSLRAWEEAARQRLQSMKELVPTPSSPHTSSTGPKSPRVP